MPRGGHLGVVAYRAVDAGGDGPVGGFPPLRLERAGAERGRGALCHDGPHAPRDGEPAAGGDRARGRTAAGDL